MKSNLYSLYSIFLSVTLFSLYGCGSSDLGELVGGANNSYWESPQPYGMSLIPAGSFSMGSTDVDIAHLETAPIRTVSVAAFYMDETEISNSEYRQFVSWVRDSIARAKLAQKVEELGLDPEVSEEGIVDYRYKELDTTSSPYYQYMLQSYGHFGDPYSETKGREINWDIPLVWDINEFPDIYYAEVMDSLLTSPEESIDGGRNIDISKLKYKYTWIDVEKSVRKKLKRSESIVREEVLIYPDTTVWIKDFTYSYNEPFHNDYFWHPAFANYPVVGVSFNQAKAFCNWRTQYKNRYLASIGESKVINFRLPTESEWEYAARGGEQLSTYPWGGPYTRDEKGCFLANFKPMRGDYMSDGIMYTAPVDSYFPNGYNLYNMAGNVAEWTNSTYNEMSYHFASTMNPNYVKTNDSRKTIRGGSWKDISYFIRVSTRDYEYGDTVRSYIGFRTVQSAKGTSAFGISNPNLDAFN